MALQALWLCGVGLRKGTMASASTSVWEKAAPPSSSPDAGHFSSSQYVSDAFQSAAPTLELRQSENKSVCGPFKRNCWRFQQFLSSMASILTGFHRPELWGLIFLVLEPWAEGPGMGLGPFTLEISLPVFICPTWVWEQPIPRLHPPTSLDVVCSLSL